MRDWDELTEEEKNKEVRNNQIPVLAERYSKDEHFFEERKRTNWDSNSDQEKEDAFIEFRNDSPSKMKVGQCLGFDTNQLVIVLVDPGTPTDFF